MATTPTYERGDTIRIKATFREFSESGVVGGVVDPTAIAVNIYDADFTKISGPFVPVNTEPGVYIYDWTLPNEDGSFFIEFNGTVDGKPSIQRHKIKVKWDVV